MLTREDVMTGPDPHADDEVLEQYSMGTLDEVECARFEEHLLICAVCQERLQQTDDFVGAIRRVAPRLRAETGTRPAFSWWNAWRWPVARPQWAAAVVLVLALFFVRPWRWLPEGNPAPAMVLLQASRGPAAGLMAPAPAGRPLVLIADVTQLASAPAYRIEVVDASGRQIFSALSKTANGQVRTVSEHPLAAGLYFVRLYSPAGELVREYGLQVK
jgi:hypothetical protein